MTGSHLTKLPQWFNQPRRVYDLWLGKHCVLAAWLGLLLAVASPPKGAGVLTCWFREATTLPCPGCGLTRSLSCAMRGMLVPSWHSHPMGLFILALFIFTAAQSLLPRSFRDQLARQMQARAPIVHRLYLAFVVVFVAFGVGRAVVHWANEFA